MPKAILIVDDDPLARAAIERILTSEPRLKALEPRTLQAGDGGKALSMVAEESPDLVITDLHMPGMDGFALCRELRHGKGPDGLPILVVSGVYKDPAVALTLTQELRVSFLSKPLEPRALADEVLKMLPPARGNGLTGSSTELAAVPVDKVPGAAEHGPLGEGVVPRLLLEHIERRTTGSLVLTRGQMRKEIYLRAGRVVGADSNIREQALGEVLKAKRYVTEEQLQYLLGETRRRKQKMGTVLVDLGWLTPDQVLDCLAAQVRKRVVDALRWSEGHWSLVPGDSFGDRVIEHAVEAPRLVFRGLQRTARLETVAARFDAGAARPVLLSPRFEPFRPAFEEVFGADVLPLLDPATPLASLVLGAEPLKVAVAVEALLLSGMAALGDADPALAVPEGESGAGMSPLDALSGDGGPITSSGPDDELASRSTQAGAAPTGEHALADSGEVDLFAAPKTKPGIGPVAAASEERLDARTAVLREFLEIHGKSLYDVLGVAPDATAQEITRAYELKTRRFGDEVFAGQDLGPDAGKLEAIRGAYERAFRVLLDPALRGEYDTGRAPGPAEPAPTDALGAELDFGEGRGLLQAGKPEEALARFEHAVSARPDQAAYHAYLGWATFVARGQDAAPEARERLGHALALDPDLAVAHELYARLESSQGDHGAARRHLERALELDPEHPGEALDRLVAAYEALGDARVAERYYRRLLATVGDRAFELRRRLWRELGELYEHKLDDRERARTAWENAARMAPSDLVAQRKVVELSAEDPARWRELSRALAAEWRERPGDRGPGERLLEALTKVGQNDAAAVVAAGLLLRGTTDPSVQRLAEDGRPRLLRKLPGPLDAAVVARIAFPGEDAELEALIGAMAEAGALAGEPDPGAADAGALPAPFLRHLRYVAGALDVAVPPVRRSAADGVGARMSEGPPVALLAGPALLASADGVELGFRLARALSLAAPGRAAGAARSGKQLRPYLQAGLALARGADQTTEPEAQEVLRRLAEADPQRRARVVEAARRLVRGRQAVNLTAWTRALHRTAARIGLLVSGDLVRVGRAVLADEGQGALDDLLAFAVSVEHFDLREELGLAAVV